MSDSEETGVSRAIDESSPVVSEYDLRASHLVDTFDVAPQTRAQKKLQQNLFQLPELSQKWQPRQIQCFS